MVGHRAGKHRNHVGVNPVTIHVESLEDWQKGYIAAFLDGEGGIQITRSERRDREYRIALHPAVYFTNTYQAAIRTIHLWLGGGSVTLRRGSERHRDTLVFTVSGVRSILRLMETIRPFLLIKAKRADLMIEFCKSRVSHNKGKGRSFTESELRLYTSIKELNIKGGTKTRQPTVV